MWNFPSWLQIPLAQWIDTIMHWVLVHWGGFFDVVGNIFLHIMLPIERFLLWLPWWVVVLAVGFVAWRAMRSKWAGLIMMVFHHFIDLLRHELLGRGDEHAGHRHFIRDHLPRHRHPDWHPDGYQ